MLYRIILKNCAFFARHGLFESEEDLGQRFFLDIDLEVEAGMALTDDDISDVVDYGAVYATVTGIVTSERFRLIEALAYRVGKALCEEFAAVRKARITVRKPSVPIAGVLDHAEVSVDYEDRKV